MRKMRKSVVKRMVLFSFVAVILIGLGVIVFLRRQSNNKIAVVTQKAVVSINRSIAVNKNGYLLYMIEGRIDKIYDQNPFKFDVKVDIFKIFSDQKNKIVVKTIIVNDNTEFILHAITNKDTSKDISIKPSSLNVGDNIAVWTIESNSNILKLDQLTAEKIVKFK